MLPIYTTDVPANASVNSSESASPLLLDPSKNNVNAMFFSVEERVNFVNSLAEASGFRTPEYVPDEAECDQAYRFVQKLETVGNTRLVFESSDGERIVVDASASSRYFESGRKKIKRLIWKRLRVRSAQCKMITLTYEHSLSRAEAWERVGQDVRGFLNALQGTRRRKGQELFRYFWVVEQQKNGYPHVHIGFPGLKFLSVSRCRELWKHGFVRVTWADGQTVNIPAYICKYITKMSGWDVVAISYLWRFRKRLWSCSRFFREGVEKVQSGWKLVALCVEGMVYSKQEGRWVYTGCIDWSEFMGGIYDEAEGSCFGS